MHKLEGHYRSKENELNYLTFSQFKGLMECQKTWMDEFTLKQEGKFKEDPVRVKAFRMGRAVEAAFVNGEDGLRDAFKGDEGLLWKSPTKKSQEEYEYYQKALAWKRGDDIKVRVTPKLKEVAEGEPVPKPETTKSSLWIDALYYADKLRSIPDIRWMVNNLDHSAIMISEFGGVRFKSETDFQSTEELRAKGQHVIVDLKTSKDPFSKQWIQRKGQKGQYASFVEGHKYDLQAYIYRYAYLQNYGVMPNYYIVVVGKSEEAPVEIINMNSTDSDEYYARILDTYSEQFQRIKMGEVAPQGCGYCKNCRSVKVPTFKGAITSDMLWN